MRQRRRPLSRPHLAHELRDDAVEGGAFVAEALLPGAEGPEVLRGFGDHISVELQGEKRPSQGTRHQESHYCSLTALKRQEASFMSLLLFILMLKSSFY